LTRGKNKTGSRQRRIDQVKVRNGSFATGGSGASRSIGSRLRHFFGAGKSPAEYTKNLVSADSTQLCTTKGRSSRGSIISITRRGKGVKDKKQIVGQIKLVRMVLESIRTPTARGFGTGGDDDNKGFKKRFVEKSPE